jgi:hypothetical protein
VHVSWELVEPEVLPWPLREVNVDDCGPGIMAELHELAFRPSSGSSRREAGTPGGPDLDLQWPEALHEPTAAT